MAKNLRIPAFVLTVLCLCSLAHCTEGDRKFSDKEIFVEGKVYCDPCRFQFESRLSEPMEGATVRMECRSRENDTVGYTLEGKTDKNGRYSLPVAMDEDFEEQICEVTPITSSRDDCNENFFDFNKARVLLTYNNGIKTMGRYANPIGFMKKEAEDVCDDVLKELFPDEDAPKELTKESTTN